jgi:peptidoglycan lytic transglycosylase
MHISVKQELSDVTRVGFKRGRMVALIGALVFQGCSLVTRGHPGQAGPRGPAEAGAGASSRPPSGSTVADLLRTPDAVPRQEFKTRAGNPESYEVNGRSYAVLESSKGYVERGLASWYGEDFHGRRASSGERYDMYGMSAAHRSLPIPTYVRVTSLENGRSVVVRVNDRGPFVDTQQRIIDLSYTAALKLGVVGPGTMRVEVRALEPAAIDRQGR